MCDCDCIKVSLIKSLKNASLSLIDKSTRNSLPIVWVESLILQSLMRLQYFFHALYLLLSLRGSTGQNPISIALKHVGRYRIIVLDSSYSRSVELELRPTK
jgi:hypothetical protein